MCSNRETSDIANDGDGFILGYGGMEKTCGSSWKKGVRIIYKYDDQPYPTVIECTDWMFMGKTENSSNGAHAVRASTLDEEKMLMQNLKEWVQACEAKTKPESEIQHKRNAKPAVQKSIAPDDSKVKATATQQDKDIRKLKTELNKAEAEVRTLAGANAKLQSKNDDLEAKAADPTGQGQRGSRGARASAPVNLQGKIDNLVSEVTQQKALLADRDKQLKEARAETRRWESKYDEYITNNQPMQQNQAGTQHVSVPGITVPGITVPPSTDGTMATSEVLKLIVATQQHQQSNAMYTSNTPHVPLGNNTNFLQSLLTPTHQQQSTLAQLAQLQNLQGLFR